MAKETYITKCYNWETNETIALYESFGWELISNNVITSINNSSNLNVAAENELTFTRDKDASWYSAVNRLQQEYVGCNNQLEAILATDPTKEIKFNIVLFIVMLIFLNFIGLIYLGIYFMQANNQKKKEKEWHEQNDAQINTLNNRRAQIVAECRALIAGV